MTISSSQSWVGAGLTDIGRVRKKNQDAFSIANEHQLWVVADGMGGHAGGEVAAQIAVETIPEYIKNQLQANSSDPIPAPDLEKMLLEALEWANTLIREKASLNSEIKGMGTTVVAIAMTRTPEEHQAVIAHAGDSRAYVLRDHTLSLLTKDHTLMEERLDLKLITPAQVKTHPLRHVVTRGLGIESQALPTVNTYSLKPSDVLLLCSDGLTKMLSDSEIETLMKREASNLEQMTHTFVKTANRLGGEDNTTVVAIGAVPEATL